ncbi:MAG: hypothetical protein KC777_04535 [Cyanobacteria bacterium HKST-UBA02]|nr:hypothetical protein [Cyanobacteria bacterium HKST-UBA02]
MTVTTTIENSGMIEQLRLPEAFTPAMAAGEQHHGYLEFKGRGSCALICYEHSNRTFTEHETATVAQALSQELRAGESKAIIEDSELFDVLCFCFVFGGALTRGGTVMDMPRCSWELCGVETGTTNGADSGQGTARTVIVGRLKFLDVSGKRSKREVVVVLPQAPGPEGCGYLWLEGGSSDIRRFETNFMQALAAASYRQSWSDNSDAGGFGGY